MSCKHGNHEDACDICDEVSAAYESGLAARLAAPAVANPAMPQLPLLPMGVQASLYNNKRLVYTEQQIWEYGVLCAAAIASAQQAAPKAALTDDQIIAYWLNIDSWPVKMEDGENIAKFARAIEAAAAPNAALVEALKEITQDYSERFDLESPSTNPGIKNSIAQDRAALAAAGVKP